MLELSGLQSLVWRFGWGGEGWSGEGSAVLVQGLDTESITPRQWRGSWKKRERSRSLSALGFKPATSQSWVRCLNCSANKQQPPMNFLSNWPRLCESPLWLLLSSSSSNNIQDQCLIITDFYGVQEKGCVAGEKKSKNLIPNPNTVTGLPVADVELLAGKMLF